MKMKEPFLSIIIPVYNGLIKYRKTTKIISYL